MTLFGGRVDDVSHMRIRRRLYYHCRSNLLYYRTERALDKSGISVAPPKRTRGRRVVKSEGPVRVSTRLRVKDQNNDENSERNESSSDENRKVIESGEEIEKSDEDEGEDMIEDEGEDEGEDMIEDEGEDEGEDMIEDEGEVTMVIENAVGPAGPAGPASPVSPALGPTMPALGPTVPALDPTVPAITVLPATPVKNKGKSQVTPDDNQAMPQDYPPDPDFLMDDHDQYKLKHGRERSGTGDVRGIRTHRRSASHSTAPTVPSTEDDELDELDPRGSSRTTGGFSRGKAMGNNFNWGDADDVAHSVDWNAPTYGKVLLFVDRETGAPPYMSFTTETTSELPVVLKELSGRFSPIERRNCRIYVFEDEMWEVKGRFSQAIKDNVPVQWEMNDEGKLVLYLLAVGVFFFTLSTFIT